MAWLTILLTLCVLPCARRLTRRMVASVGVALAAAMSLLLSGVFLVADQLTGHGINDAAIYHLTHSTSGVPLWDFWPQVLAASIFVAAALVLGWLVFRASRARGHDRPRRGAWIVVLGLLALAYVINPASGDLAQVVRDYAAQQPQEMPPEFVDVSAVDLPRAKNLVYLYLESFERTYLDEHLFPGLVPNLQALRARALDFTDVRQIGGTGWTIAGMVASQCGAPLALELGGNSMSGVDQFLPNATCLGDLLSANGYDTHFYGGAKLSFAGKGNFYRTHGFRDVKGRDALASQLKDPAYLNSWGLYDDSLLGMLASEFDRLAARPAPFALFAITLDTHHPDGFVGASCTRRTYGDGSNPILNAVHCSDEIVAGFIRHVLASPAFKDTLLVVASDHLALPTNTALDVLNQGERRDLLWIFDADRPGARIDKPGSTVDVAPTLLRLLGSRERGFGFGRDLLDDAPTLMASGEAGDLSTRYRGFLDTLWAFPQLSTGFTIDVPQRRLRVGERAVKLPALFLLGRDGRVQSVAFQFDSDRTLAEEVAALDPAQNFVWVDTCRSVAGLVADGSPPGDGYCLARGALGDQALAVQPLEGVDEVAAAEIVRWFGATRTNAALASARSETLRNLAIYGVADVAQFSGTGVGDYVFRSSGGPANDSWIARGDGAERLALKRGINLVGLDAARPPEVLRRVDGCGAAPDARMEPLAETIGHRKDDFAAFAVVVADSAVCHDQSLDDLFAGTGLAQWREIGVRSPYVGIIERSGQTWERLGRRGATVAAHATGFLDAVPRDNRR